MSNELLNNFAPESVALRAATKALEDADKDAMTRSPNGIYSDADAAIISNLIKAEDAASEAWLVAIRSVRVKYEAALKDMSRDEIDSAETNTNDTLWEYGLSRETDELCFMRLFLAHQF